MNTLQSKQGQWRQVYLFFPKINPLWNKILKASELLKAYLIISQIEILPLEKKTDSAVQAIDGIFVEVSHADGEKCVRCWNYFTEKYDDGEVLCKKCREALEDSKK